MPPWAGIAIKTSAVWFIALLLLVIAGLILILPNGQFLVNYVSFAASIASLILALVAIFYSIISSEGFYRSIGKVQGLAEEIQEGSQRVADNSANFAESSRNLLDQLSQIPGSVDKMAERFEGRFDDIMSSVSVRSPADTKGEKGKFFIESPTLGSSVAVYLVARASKEQREFNIDNIFSTPSMKDYAQGFITCMAALHVKGVKISFHKSLFRVNDLGEVDADYIIESVSSRHEKGFVKTHIDEINAYFAKLDFEEVAEG